MITQANRLLSIETPHAFDTLLIGGVRGVESLSRPFQYHVQLLADVASGRHTQVDPEQLIGNAVTVAVHLLDDEQRYIHGIVKNFTVGGQDERFVHYRADLVPWF